VSSLEQSTRLSHDPDLSIIAIDLVSDIICPWCYVGFRALLSACAQMPSLPTSIAMRAFELDPTTPKEGADHKARLLAKFGGDQARLNDIRAALVEAGRNVGIEFNLDAIKLTPNTRDCHRLLRWARTAGVELECAEALFRAYHVEGEDLTQASTLLAIARGLGMDGALVSDLLKSDCDNDAVVQEIRTAQNMGVTSVPCAIFNQGFAVLGAQPVEVFVGALETASQALPNQLAKG
jgi:predicted DsbA family dithiol-disulfide isomerase